MSGRHMVRYAIAKIARESSPHDPPPTTMNHTFPLQGILRAIHNGIYSFPGEGNKPNLGQNLPACRALVTR
jgi:hypothetical protein